MPAQENKGLELKLFVWNEEVLIDAANTTGIMAALAENIEKARELVLTKAYHEALNMKESKITKNNFITDYYRFVKKLTCHGPSVFTCNNYEMESGPDVNIRQLYHDLSLQPRIIEKPECFMVWGSNY